MIPVDDGNSSTKNETPNHLKILDAIDAKHCQSLKAPGLTGHHACKSTKDEQARVTTKEPSYEERLTARVSTEYASMFTELRKEKSPLDAKATKKSIPATRKSVLKDIKGKILTAKEQLDEMRARKAREYSASKTASASHTDKAEGPQDNNARPAHKEKPFGANKNIHTLGCFNSESSKQVKSLGGRKFGFDDNK